MAALPTPLNVFVLNARLNGVTRFIQEGTGFTAGTTVALTDENATAADRYVFAVTSVAALSARRLLVTATCTTLPTSNNRFADGRVRVVTTTGANPPDDTGPVAAVFLTRRQPLFDPTKAERQRLRLKVGAKSVLYVPVTGLGEVVTAAVTATAGTWTVVKAAQRRNRVRLVLQCVTTATTTATAGPASAVSVTLNAEDATVVEVPPLEIEFEEPDDDPDA